MKVSKRITITNIGATENKFPGSTWEQVHNFNFYSGSRLREVHP